MVEPLQDVAISSVKGGYLSVFPFDPDERFPEYAGSLSEGVPNPVYRAVRENFILLGYDKDHVGTAVWNPLGHLVRPGNRVFIKPNLCTHEYGRKKEALEGDIFSVITHPSVVRVVADYVAIALKGNGEIVIGDNPTIDADFVKLMAVTHLDRFAEFYEAAHGIRCSVVDLREMWCADVRQYGSKSLMQHLRGDPEGDTVVNLGKTSFFYGLNPLLYRGVFTNRWETIRHHHGKRQEYAVANSIYQADVYISIPKLKTHHKVGATLNVKGLVGMCTKKNYLIHWRIGFPSWGGDEYPEPKRAIDHLLLAIRHLAIALTPTRMGARIAQRFKDHAITKLFRMGPYCGSWEGNDTCWRMAADLYLVLLSRERKCLSIVDGVVGGDLNGPFCTRRKDAHIVITGENLVLVDAVAVRMMDFCIGRVQYLSKLVQRCGLDLENTRICTKDYDTSNFFTDRRRYLAFGAPSGWPNLSIQNGATKS